MPPARPRNLDDSRSETSSTITNQKEKSLLGPYAGAGISKGKKTATSILSTSGAMTKNGTTATHSVPTFTTAAAAAAEKDSNKPRTEWTTIPNSILEAYRNANRLPVPAAYAHPHAHITYTSSSAALRSPSAVLARRRQRDEKHKRRNLNGHTNGTKLVVSKDKTVEKSKTKQKWKEDDLAATAISTSILTAPSSAQVPSSPSAPSTASTYLGPREPPSSLANSVRKHFNAQQLNEAETIARFIYVVQQNGRSVSVEGSAGDGTGWWMGSHGREVRRVDPPAGEVGFRLRFRP